MIPESMRLLMGGGEGGGGERDGNLGVMRGEQWGGDGGGIQLRYCDGVAAHPATPCQYHQVSATHTIVFIHDKHGHLLHQWYPTCDTRTPGGTRWAGWFTKRYCCKM